MNRATDGTGKGDIAGRIADSMKGKLGDIAAEAARTAVESNLDKAASAVEDRYGAIIDPPVQAADRIAEFVRSRPLVALLLAAATGFVIGRT